MKWQDILTLASTGASTGTAIWAGNKAAGAQEDAAQAATEIAGRQLDFQKELLAPYQRVGTPALNALAYGLGLDIGPTPAGGYQNAFLQPQNDYLRNLDSLTPGSGPGVGGRAASGALAGWEVAGPFGAAIGAPVGAATTLFGRGRREADQLVPYQNALAQESARIGKLIESGQVSAYEGGQYMQDLIDRYKTVASQFGRAGPGAIATVDQYLTPTANEWASSAPPVNAMAPGGTANAMTPPAGLDFGEFNKQFTGEDLATEPGYQFGLSEGMKAVQRQLAAQGKLLSGGAGKALTSYAEDYAGGKFNDAFNRFQINQDARWNRLASLAGIGQTATTQLLGASGNYGDIAGRNAILGGEARAGGAIATGTAVNEGIGAGIDQWNQRQILNALANQNNTIPSV